MESAVKTISVEEAAKTFEQCLREVEAGEEFVITRKGQPVARLLPVGHQRVLTPEQEAALARLCDRMDHGWHLGGEPLDRDELYANARRPYDPHRR